MSQNKTPRNVFCDNIDKYESILRILPLLHFAMNRERSCYNLPPTSNLLPHYLAKFECSTVQLYTIGAKINGGLDRVPKNFRQPFKVKRSIAKVPKSMTLDDLDRPISTLLQKRCVFRSPPQKIE